MPPDSSDARQVELELSEFAAGLSYGDIPAGACQAFDRLLLDFVAVVMAGLSDPACVRAADAFGGLSQFGADAPASTFALGVCAHWFDWDDTDDVSHVHGGAVIFPALLAHAASQLAARPAPAHEDFAAAAIAGYEIACGIGGHLRSHGHIGWMPTGSGASLGAAAALGRQSGCTALEVRSAMGIAAANAGISRQALSDRTSSKGVLAGIAARTAVDAFTMARRGIEGPSRFLNGGYGLCELHANGARVVSVADLGSKFLIERVSVKPYPCCRSAHAVIDGVLRFREESPDAARSIGGIEVCAPPGVFERCGAAFAIGDNARLSAQFSIPYTAALALRQGAIELADFGASSVAANASELKALIGAIRVHRDPVVTSDVLAPVRLRMMSNDTVVAERTVTSLKGDPKTPLTSAEQHGKLRSAARSMLDEAAIVDLEARLRALQREGPRVLLDWLRPRLHTRAAAIGS